MHIRWDPELAVGIPEIDEQHQELFQRAEALLEALRDSHGQGEIARLIPFLHDYIVEHFAAEEKLMAVHDYSRAPEHVSQHRRFVDDFLELQTEVQKSGANAALAWKASRFLERWLKRHITVSDQALGAFLLARDGRDTLLRARALTRPMS